MRGHVTKRSKNSWTIVMDLGRDPASGKRRQQWLSVKGTKREAERKLAELQHQLNTGGYVKPTRLTTAEFLVKWLEEHAKPNVAPTTFQGYEHVVKRHLIPGLGSIALAELAPLHLQAYYVEKLERGRLDGKGGLGAHTVNHHHVTLHDALQTAVRWNLVARNVADAVDRPKFQSPEMKTFDEDELKAFLDAARETPYYHLFYLTLFTGLRRSELLGLRWDDADLTLGQLYINRGLTHLRDGRNVIRTPKTPKGRRMVALPPSAALVLREHRENQTAQRLVQGLSALQGSALIFSKLDGSPMLPDTVSQAWRKLVRRTGFQGIRLHDARHTHASLLLKQGVHPKIVQERLGHATIATTLDTYSHVAPGLQEAAAKQFDTLAGPPTADAPVSSPATVG